MNSEEVDSVFYDETQIKVMEAGIAEIAKYIDGSKTKEIRSLLLCLDKYLDPYYGYELPYEKEIYDILESLLKTSKDLNVKEDALNFLQMYSDRDYENCEIAESGELKRFEN